MRLLRTVAGLWCVACLALVAWGQEAAEPVAPPTPQPVVEAPPAPAPTTAVVLPKPESVLEHIPADALGYVVVPDVRGMLGRVDKYLAEVGLAEILGPMMPNGALESVRGAAMLGEGFNPSGGFAVVMVDPAKVGVDLLAMMGLAEAPASQPETEPVEMKLPIVILVPGVSIQGVFGNYPITPGEKYSEVALRMGPMQAVQMGGYVAVSPSAKALDVLVASATSVAATAPVEQAELLARSDITVHINMEIAWPLVDKGLTIAGEKMEEGYAPPLVKAIWSTYMGMYKELGSQMTSVCLAGRFAPTGLVIEAMAGFKPDSSLGRAMAATQALPGRNLLSRVSNPSYVLAVGAAEKPSPPTQEQEKTLATEMTDTWMTLPPFSMLDEKTKADLKALIVAMSDQQAGGMQLIIGGAPEGSGLFAASAVLQCKDSAALKELILGAVPLAETIIKTVTEEKELPFKIVAARAVTTVNGLSVDAIEFVLAAEQEEAPTTEPEAPTAAPTTESVDPPEAPLASSAPAEEPTTTAEAEKNPVAVVMGEDKIRIYLVAVDPQTLVVTCGGAQAHLADAVRVAKAADGASLSDPTVAEALAVMPKNLSTVALLNVGNLFDVIINAAVTMEGPGSSPPFRVTTKAPIAFGGGVSGTMAHAVYYIPNDLVKEGVSIFKTLAGPRPMPGSAPSGEGDF